MKRKFLRALSVIFITALLPIPMGCANNDEANVNFVIQVEFSDTQEPFTPADSQNLSEAFNGDNGLDKFIEKNSDGKHEVESRILGVVRINKEIDCFMPKYTYNAESQTYEEINEKGYDNRLFDEEGNPSAEGKQSVERFYREQELVYLVTQHAKDLLKGKDKRTEIENVTVVFSKLNRDVYRNDIFHPHRANGDKAQTRIATEYYNDGVERQSRELKLGKKDVTSYILVPYAYISDGKSVTSTTVCHEYMHVLGVPDMYSYEKTVKPVGEFDVMGGELTQSPTLSLSYVRCKMGWLNEGENILPVSKSGRYDLFSAESQNEVKAYKITPGSYYEKGEAFYLEYRTFTQGSASIDGVIIYRVKEENGYISSSGEKSAVWQGNAYGEYEAVVFRNLLDLWYGSNPTLTDREGYRTYGDADGSANVLFYSDGENSGIEVEYLGKNADGSVKVDITLPEEEIVVPTQKKGLKYDSSRNRYAVYFDDVDEGTAARIFYADKRIKKPTPEKLLKSKKGEMISLNTVFLKADLPKYQGYEKYVYVFYEKDGRYSQVEEYKIEGIKNVKIGAVLAVAVAVGIIIPAALLTFISKTSKKRRNKNEG